MRQGGVYHTGFQKHWFNNIVVPGQYGRLEGLDEKELAKNRYDFTSIETKWIWRSEGPWPVLDRTRAVQEINVPILSAGNWIDAEIHLPGNLVAFEESSSEWKFLEMHTGNHLYDYYERSQVERQRKFLDYFLLDKRNNGLDKAPRIELLIRRGTENFYRTESSWPPKDAQYVSLYFTPEEKLSFIVYTPPSQDDMLTYPGLTGSSEFQTDLFEEPLEILGYPYLELTVSTDAKDMDIFVYFYVIGPQGEKLVFKGGHDEPAVSFVRTWFRLSHRTLSEKSTAHRPILDQRLPAPVKANAFYTVKIPIPPTSMIIAKNHKLAVTLRANDEDAVIPPMRHMGEDRSEDIFGGTNRIIYGGRLVLPVINRGL
jgi:predicted acyl esterase